MTTETLEKPAASAPRIRDLSFALCGVCGGPNDAGFGYAPDDARKIMWTCTDCLPIASHVYGIPPMQKTKHSAEARDFAGEQAGAYLEKIGKFSLDDLTQEEWREFLDTFLKNYTTQMRRLGAEYAPPF